MEIFIEVLLPIALIFMGGYWLQKKQVLEIRSISAVALYILTPALVFRTFYTTVPDRNYLIIVVFSIVFLVIMLLCNFIVSKIFKWDSKTISGMNLATIFTNAGNYGAPLILFAFGEEAFAFAVIYMVVQSLLMNTFGVYVANRSNMDARGAIRISLKMPVMYALFLGLALQYLNIEMGDSYLGAIDLLADSAIPVVMVILGMQLATISVKSFQWGLVGYGTILRLVLSPVIAYVLTLMMPASPTLAAVLIVSASMPSAATTAMLAVQFDANPKLVSSITLVTTVLSVPSLWILLTLLQ
ncbi:AEC family transporter [Bacillus sp. FJAT-44742]|uniref:AEC family transporter n=1 Tax=Bacillus sp. FJAT-44742 TaxID=2014005 RepID=UPI000C24679C|nr:AEC family transporter [Bacillus sp. FJAT-44742]